MTLPTAEPAREAETTEASHLKGNPAGIRMRISSAEVIDPPRRSVTAIVAGDTGVAAPTVNDWLAADEMETSNAGGAAKANVRAEAITSFAYWKRRISVRISFSVGNVT